MINMIPIKKIKFKDFMEIAFLIFFVLISAFIVLNYEYQEGNFLFKFFKFKLYYASFNKVVVPLIFWSFAFFFY
jgi:hypothetical protein